MDNIFLGEIKPKTNGLNIAIKDSIDILGYQTVAGSRALENTEAALNNADVIDLLIEKNCNILGKTNLHELAFGITGINQYTGTPINPKYPELIPGGSSSGSAAAVASGKADIAIGTDTGGSIRMPAACCGVYGLKPTYGRVSRRGVWPKESSLDCVGPMANNMELIIQAMDAICPDFDIEKARSVYPAKIAWIKTEASEEVSETIQKFLTSVDLMDLPQIELSFFKSAYQAGMQVINFETWQAFGELTKTGLVGSDVQNRLLNAAATTTDDVEQANQIREKFCQELDGWLEQYDVLMLPTLPVIPPKVSEAANTAAFLNLTALIRPFNLSGHPALSIPLETVDGFPVGLQLVAKHQHEEKLCAIANYLVNAAKQVSEELHS